MAAKAAYLWLPFLSSLPGTDLEETRPPEPRQPRDKLQCF